MTFRTMPFGIVVAMAAVLAVTAAGCGRNSRRYNAEKALFAARNMREQFVQNRSTPEFIDRIVLAYRGVVKEYAGDMDSLDGLGAIVVSAQMELAEFEFRTRLFDEAIADFEKAYELARREPAARANAIYSIAVIGEMTGDPEGAVAGYERFHREFLDTESIPETAMFNSRYLIAPLKLADLHARAGDAGKTGTWLKEAERVYLAAIEGVKNETVVKEMRYNLVTTYMKGERWREALSLIAELKTRYNTKTDLPGFLFIEATIHRDGLGNAAKALELLRTIHARYPESPEAVNALMTEGSMQLEAGRFDEAQRLYQSIVDMHGETEDQIVEASWQLALIAEDRGNWVDASLYYKLIYQRYPTSIPGLEAPLRIAGYYRKRNEREAAASALVRAIEHYETLVSSQISDGARVMVEEYLVRAFADQGEWSKAADRLLELAGKYPAYTQFSENYLRAASIYEHELNDAERAAEILNECVNRYPGTDLAAEAERQYKRIMGTR